jgi:hypothetical protein
MTSVEQKPPRALLAGASRRWVRLLPWGVAFVLCVALLPTTIQVLSVDYGLNRGIASVLAVAQAAPLLLAVVRPLRAWYVIFAADVAGALALLTVDFATQGPAATGARTMLVPRVPEPRRAGAVPLGGSRSRRGRLAPRPEAALPGQAARRTRPHHEIVGRLDPRRTRPTRNKPAAQTPCSCLPSPA